MDNEAIQKAHDDGFKSGLNWSDAWMDHGKPGGPWTPSRGYNNTPKWIETCEQLYAENKAWLKGWEEGLAEKIATGRINPHRGTDKNDYHHNSAKCAYCEDEKCA